MEAVKASTVFKRCLKPWYHKRRPHMSTPPTWPVNAVPQNA